VRIALAENDVLLRERLASLLERSGFVVVGHAGRYPLESPVVDVPAFIETIERTACGCSSSGFR
jgi:hypothetical protein